MPGRSSILYLIVNNIIWKSNIHINPSPVLFRDDCFLSSFIFSCGVYENNRMEDLEEMASMILVFLYIHTYMNIHIKNQIKSNQDLFI